MEIQIPEIQIMAVSPETPMPETLTAAVQTPIHPGIITTEVQQETAIIQTTADSRIHLPDSIQRMIIMQIRAVLRTM